MITLSYGYKKPENPNTGDDFFPAMEENIQRLNDHNHDGTDSAPLASFSVTALAASWVAAPIGGGIYRQVVTVPAGLSFDTCNVWFKASGVLVYPSVERITDTTFYVYTNDNTLAYVCYFR